MPREANSGKDTHVLIVGDFNYPKINWQTWSTEGGSVETEEYTFISCQRFLSVSTCVSNHQGERQEFSQCFRFNE